MISNLVMNGMTSTPLLTGPALAYLILIEFLGTVLGSWIILKYFKSKGIEAPWEVVAIAMSIAMITSWVLGLLAWGWIL